MMDVTLHFLRRLARDRGIPAQAGAFFALTMLVCVFAIGAQEVLLAATLPALSWAILLLSSLLGLGDSLEMAELDELVLSRLPLPGLMAAKVAAHALATGMPVALAAPPVVAMLTGMEMAALPVMWAGFLLGALTFSALGLMGAALTLGSRRNGALQAVIVLPLCIPALIFGAGSVTALQLGLGWQPPLAFLAAIACASLTLAPFAAAAIIRMKVSAC